MISVIIPVYNNPKQLKRALESVSLQSYQDVEVIVVDDGSSTPLGVENSEFNKSNLFQIQNSELKIFNIQHGGANKARNFGFTQSRGEYVIFWDADLTGRPDMLDVMFRALEEHPEASYAYSRHWYGWKKFALWEFDAERLRRMPYIHTTSLIRREHFIGFDESVKRLQDWDLWLTMLEQGHRGVLVPEYLFSVVGGGTMSSWLPKYAYRKPFRYFLPRVLRDQRDKYERAIDIIKQKHSL